MLRSRGLRPVHHFWHMQIDLDEPVEPGRSPEGIDIGGIDPGEDLAAIHALLDEAFVDDRSHHPAPFDRWVEEETGSPNYDPTMWLLARDGGHRSACSPRAPPEDRGWVDYLAVSASHRGRGIGAALLRRSFAHVRGSRHPARAGERRCAEPDRSDRCLRACRDADRELPGTSGSGKELDMPLNGEYEPSTSDWSRKQTELYEATNGEEGGDLRGRPVIVLTSVGAKTGKLRKTALMRVEHDGVYAVVASLGGAPKHPVWYYNLKKHPHVELQDGATKRDYTAREVVGDEKAVWWERAVETWPDYATYQTKTDRQIPVFVLEPMT